MGGLVACVLNLTLPDDPPEDLVAADDSSLDELEAATAGAAGAGGDVSRGSHHGGVARGASYGEDDIKEM